MWYFWWGCRRNLKVITLGSERVKIFLSFPEGQLLQTAECDQFQISPAVSGEIFHHTVWRTWFFITTQMKDDYTTSSHYLTYTFLFRKVGRMYFLNLGVKGLKRRDIPDVSVTQIDPCLRTDHLYEASTVMTVSFFFSQRTFRSSYPDISCAPCARTSWI